MTEIKIGDLISYVRNSGEPRYCVVRIIKNGDAIGNYADDIETAIRYKELPCGRYSSHRGSMNINNTSYPLTIVNRKVSNWKEEVGE